MSNITENWVEVSLNNDDNKNSFDTSFITNEALLAPSKMNNKSSLPDIQKTTPEFIVPIERVGISNLKMPINVQGREQEDLIHTVADISAYVDLPSTEKGTHMSRLAQVIHEYNNINDDIFTFKTAKLIAKQLQERCKSQRSSVIYKFPYFFAKKSPVTNLTGTLHCDVVFDMNVTENDDHRFKLIVKTIGTSVCPCSKEISKYGAHNQRSIITMECTHLKNNNDFIWIEDLIEIADDSYSASIYSILKREDEKYVTEQGYQNPLFVEDIIRKCYTFVLNKFSEKLKSFKVSVENEESIHLHNAYASMSWYR